MIRIIDAGLRLGAGYTGAVMYKIRSGRLFVSFPHLKGGRWGNYVVGGMELAYNDWTAQAVPALRLELSRRFGARKAAELIRGWKE